MSGALDMGRGHAATTFDAGGKDLVGNTNDLPQERISCKPPAGGGPGRDEGRVAGGCLTVPRWLTGMW
jgi:hypothetical protein